MVSLQSRVEKLTADRIQSHQSVKERGTIELSRRRGSTKVRCFDVVVDLERATEMFGKVELTGQNALVLARSPAKAQGIQA